MMFLFLQFLIAHLLGDFVLQPKSWVTDKEKNKIKAKSLYAHIAVHVICLSVLLGFNEKYILGFSIVIVSHFLIDLAKIYIQQKKTKRWLFFIDQTLHIIVIGLVTLLYYPVDWNFSAIFTEKTLLFIACILFVSYVCSIIMGVLLSYWDIDEITKEKNSLKNAGKYIGLLERLFVFGFIALGRWEGVGLLLGAKSVFRFGDLTAAKNRKLTEYVLIGTLLSFGLAILAGIIFNQFSK